MRQKSYVYSAFGLLAFLLLWEGFTRLSFVSQSLVPAPSDLPSAFLREYRNGKWQEMLWLSLGHYGKGFGIGSGLGVVFGVLTGMYLKLEWTFA